MGATDQKSLAFMKMHGLGNDFVVIDGRAGRAWPSDATVIAMAEFLLSFAFGNFPYCFQKSHTTGPSENSAQPSH